jgi:hypothetical protein
VELVRLADVIRIVCDFVDHWGRRPTAAELFALLQRPGQ